MNNQSAVDRACAFGILADGGPMTVLEVRDALPASEAWNYARVHRALRQLERRGWIAAAGRGSGQYVLWFLPHGAELPVP